VSLALMSLVLLVSAFLGYVTDRFRLSPLLGFFIGGFLVKLLFSEFGLGDLFGVGEGFFRDVGVLLLTLSGVLIAFEMGRDVGVVGFNPKLAYVVVVEASIILVFSLLIARALGFPLLESLVVAIVFLSSSTITIYRLTMGLKPEEVRRIALTITTLEDLALLTALSLVAGGHENPLVTLSLSVLFALAASFIFRTAMSLLAGSAEFQVIIALTLTLGYASLTQLFASPYLGAFVAGYFLGRFVGYRISFEPYAGLIALLYMVSVSFVTPVAGGFRVEVLLTLAILVVTALAVRMLSVFLATLLILRNSFYALTLSGIAISISELAPLAVLTAYTGGLIGSDIALALTLLPLATIALSNVTYRVFTSWAGIASKYVVLELPILVPESVYEIGVRVMVTSAKISGVLLLAVLATFGLNMVGLAPLGMGALALAVLVTLRFYRELWLETSIIGELPGFIARMLSVLVAGATSAYVIHETLRTLKGFEGLAWIAVISLYVLIAFIVVEVVRTARRYAEKLAAKMRPPL